MVWHIEVREKQRIFDAVGEGIKRDIRDLGIDSVERVHFVQVYVITGDVGEDRARLIADELLADKVTQAYTFEPIAYNPREYHVVEVAYNPGVMDPAEESVLKGISDLGIEGVMAVKTAKKYIIQGRLSNRQLHIICEKLLYNKLIQHIVEVPNPNGSTRPVRLTSFAHGCPERSRRTLTIGTERSQSPKSQIPKQGGMDYRFNLITVDLLKASHEELRRISKAGQLFLNLAEMRRIKDYFKKLKRNPTDCELETIAQTWSEHCWHKTFRGKIKYIEKIPISKSQIPKSKFKTKIINNLLKSTIMKVTKELNKPWCVSVFQDNSGIIKFDDQYNVCFKVETHNHPSALEPFGGANTGIGGVIRDPLGTGLGARPILNTDVFCFGPPDYPFQKLPVGALHPKRIMKGVVSGVRDYGNKMGIPTINGAILFHEGFVGNPLVYCGTVGIMPKDKSFKSPQRGDFIVLAGGRTGRDGIHGATFSSAELTQESERVSGGAVQIGNPIQEKKMADTILQARDKNLYNAITDCGAGGLSSAVGEMGQGLGAEVRLEKVLLKYAGLSYAEIWISESQERMVLSVPEKNIEEIMAVFARENVEAAIIGEFTGTKRLKLYYQDNLVCNLDMHFLHKGLPPIEKKAVYIQPRYKVPKFKCPENLTQDLLKLLSDYDICSKEWVIRQYDHEVQGGSALKPLVGITDDGPSDASIVKPCLGSDRGIIVSCGINFRFGFIDPYWMAASCIDEALRQIISVGGSLKEVALLDNFCWGNPDKADRLGSLVRAAHGCYDIAKGFGVPFISGKDSLNNEYAVNGKSMAIPGTLLISAIAVMQDINKKVTMYAKEAGGLIYALGDTYNELGGSHYYDMLGLIGNNVPRVFPDKAKRVFESLAAASASGLIKAMHDCSEGGIAVCASEMAFSGGLGMEIFLSEVPYTEIPNPKSKIPNARGDFILFSESNSRFIVEIEKKKQKGFEKILHSKGVPFGLIGCVSSEREFKVYGLDGKVCIKAGIDELKEAWQKPLRW